MKAKPVMPTAESLRKQIEARAYMLWERAGRPHGRHEEHWNQAEKGQSNAQTSVQEKRHPQEDVNRPERKDFLRHDRWALAPGSFHDPGNLPGDRREILQFFSHVAVVPRRVRLVAFQIDAQGCTLGSRA
jgi:hypothetical protein